MVTMSLPAVLAGRAGGSRTLSASGSTVGEVLEDVEAEYAELIQLIRSGDGISRFVNVYVNDADVRGSGGLLTPVADGDEIVVIPAVAGG